jgi:flagellar biosynthesis/type III secretory pathway protein FliH
LFKVSRELVRLRREAAVVREAVRETAPSPDLPAPDALPQEETPEISQRDEAAELAAQESRDALDSARREAETLRAQAEADAAELRARAYDEGFAQGYSEGETQSARELAELTQANQEAMARVLEEFDRAQAGALGELKDEMKRLIFEIVEKIIKLAHKNDDKVFGALISGALDAIKPEGRLTVNVSEADYARFFGAEGAFTDLSGYAVTASVVSDPSLSETDLLIDVGELTADAGVTSQLRRVKLAFEQAGVL